MSVERKRDNDKVEFETYRTVCPVPEIEILKRKNVVLETELEHLSDRVSALEKALENTIKIITKSEFSMINEQPKKSHENSFDNFMDELLSNHPMQYFSVSIHELEQKLSQKEYKNVNGKETNLYHENKNESSFMYAHNLNMEMNSIRKKTYSIRMIDTYRRDMKKRVLREIIFRVNNNEDNVIYNKPDDSQCLKIHSYITPFPLEIKYGDTFVEVADKLNIPSEKKYRVTEYMQGNRKIKLLPFSGIIVSSDMYKLQFGFSKEAVAYQLDSLKISIKT